MDIKAPPPDMPVLIAGPTASGKSALALEIAETYGGQVINADALQVYDCWRVLTARPTPEDEARAPHALYGHVPFEAEYSVGQWLRDLTPFLAADERPIIVGGTGLYFRALAEGLAEVPESPAPIRAEADTLPLAKLISDLDRIDPVLSARIDRQNRARVQRGWEVWHATGKPLSAWQAETPPALLPIGRAHPIVVDAQADWLNTRIAARFDQMLADGALEEVKANLPRWAEAGGSRKAIGAAELIAYVKGQLSLDEAREAAIIATRQFAKRQRTWFRARMAGWQHLAQP